MKDKPQLGDNIAIQDNNDGRGIHAMIVSLNPDGSVDLAHISRNPEPGNSVTDSLLQEFKSQYGDNTGISQSVHYDSYADFDKGWGKLNYLPLKNASMLDKIKSLYYKISGGRDE